MSDFNGYAVFFFPQAIEALGGAIQPYLQDTPAGPHVLCREIDAGGTLIELTLEGRTPDGLPVDLELMLPTSMVRMIVSARSDASFGFGPRVAVEPAPEIAPTVVPAKAPAGKSSKPAKGKPAKKKSAKKATKKPAKPKSKPKKSGR